MTNEERTILAVTSYGHFASHFNMLVFPALVLPLAARTGLDMPSVLELSVGMYLLFGITALPWGLASDRWGPRPLLVLFFAGAGSCSLGAALLVDNPALFSLCLAGVGFFSGIYHPAGLGLISTGVRSVSLAMGINGMFGNVGIALAPLLAGLVNWLGGPAWSFALMTLVNMGGVVLALGLASQGGGETKQPGDAPQGIKTWLPFGVLLLAMMMGGMCYRGTSVILPTLFELRTPQIHTWLAGWGWQDVSANLVASSLTALVYVMGIGAQFLGGWLGQRYDAFRTYLAFNVLAIPGAILALWATGAPLVLACMWYLFFLLGMQPVENTIVSGLTPPGRRATAFGIKFVFTFGVSSSAVWLVSQVTGVWGIQWVVPLLGGFSILLVAGITALGVVLRRMSLREAVS